MIKITDINIPRVVSLNISKGGIPKLPVDSVEINFTGLKGDGHNHVKHYRPEQAVSLQDFEKLLELNKEGYSLLCGTTGENISVCHLNVNGLALGTILNFSGGVQLEISKIRQPCYVLDAIDPALKKNILGRCGMYAKVIKEGVVKTAEPIQVVRPQIEIITHDFPRTPALLS